jgi:hypothetical protein
MRYDNETIYVGNWYNDEKDGFGYDINISNFQMYEGYFYLGLKHGEGFEFIYKPKDKVIDIANYIDYFKQPKWEIIEELIAEDLWDNIFSEKENRKLYDIGFVSDESKYKIGIWKNGTYIGPGIDTISNKKWIFF